MACGLLQALHNLFKSHSCDGHPSEMSRAQQAAGDASGVDSCYILMFCNSRAMQPTIATTYDSHNLCGAAENAYFKAGQGAGGEDTWNYLLTTPFKARHKLAAAEFSSCYHIIEVALYIVLQAPEVYPDKTYLAWCEGSANRICFGSNEPCLQDLLLTHATVTRKAQSQELHHMLRLLSSFLQNLTGMSSVCRLVPVQRTSI